MAKEKICGVYCIENLMNHKRYIGQSTNIYQRWNNHKNALNNNRHCNERLQNDWYEYGESSFSFYVITQCEKSELDSEESFWVSYYDSYYNGYNMTEGGESNPMSYSYLRQKVSTGIKGNQHWLGKHHTDETKMKISQGNKGKFVSDKTRKKLSIAKSHPNGRIGKLSALSKPIRQIDKKTGEILNIFESIRQAEIYFVGKSTGNIKRVLSERQSNRTAYGYRWEYV
jgi:group I intron endonuclease